MAAEILNVVIIPDSTADDDEISILYETPGSFKKGTSKFDAIPVDNYRHTPKRVINLSQFDDEVKLLPSLPKTLKKRFFKGESSNSKSEAPAESSIPSLKKRFFKSESSNSKSEAPAESSIPLTFTCEICADEKSIDDVFRVLGCNHSYCSDCMAKYIGTKLQDNISNINCPVSGCNGYLELQHCRSILPKQVFDRWGDALCEAVILATEKFYCPYKDCSALLVDDRCGGNEVISQSECPECNRLFCVQCKVPWHVGIVCAEFQKLKKDERSNEDIMLMNLAKSKKWMRCPKCQFYVERSQGCLFMRCSVSLALRKFKLCSYRQKGEEWVRLCREWWCGYTFCYNCGAPLKDHYCTNCKH